MILYIYLLYHEIVINCTENIGCYQMSLHSFRFVLGAGMAELLFEIPKIIQIFINKGGKNANSKSV
jgi:hypothetical protein